MSFRHLGGSFLSLFSFIVHFFQQTGIPLVSQFSKQESGEDENLGGEGVSGKEGA